MKENNKGLNNFLDVCKRILDIHASRKQMYARENYVPFMNKALSKEIMRRTRLRIKLCERSEENKTRYSKQRNCVSFLRKSKSEYFGIRKNISDKKTFWKTIKHFLLEKVTFEIQNDVNR